MPKRVIKHISRQRHAWKQRWFLRPFHSLLEDPAYWSLQRHSVTRAFALGLLIAFVPLPVHMILAALLALLLRVNIPVAVAAVFITNPFTMVPLFFLAYLVGCQLLGIGAGHNFNFQLSWDWLQTGLLPVWKPFLLGCLVMGLATAIVGYVTLASIWHWVLVRRYHKRKRASKANN